MKSILFICLTFVSCITLNAQTNIYDYVKLGHYQVGFMDTILLDSKYDYKFLDYNGEKPYFVQIWHPIRNNTNNYLNISDYFTCRPTPELKQVRELLEIEYEKIFVETYLTENLENGEDNRYGGHSYSDVFHLIGKMETRSLFDENLIESDFPIIIYHNGAQGHPFENFAMAEYFASRGYIFIAASFELQFENNPFGLLPYERYITTEEEESLRTIAAFAKSLSRSSSVFFVGHSFGAQMGLRTFGQDSTIHGMVSLETTIEFQTDYEKIKEMWPEVYEKVATEKVDYPFPILFCAATGDKNPFNFVKTAKTEQSIYVGTKSEFEHNAYLAFFYLRYFLDNHLQPSDKTILENRLHLYVKHLDVINDFIEANLMDKNRTDTNSIFIED